MKTTADVSNATIPATGPGNANYHGITDSSSLDPKVDILTVNLTVNQDPISNSDELLQVTDLSFLNFECDKGRTPNVKGNLKRNISFWRTISAPRFILDVIELGYKLPFETLPESVHLNNNNQLKNTQRLLMKLFQNSLALAELFRLLPFLTLSILYQSQSKRAVKRG